MSAAANNEQPDVERTDAYALLQSLAEVAEQVAATTKKLAKVALVGDYLKQLNDADLSRAARYFAGHQFPLNDSRTTNVGGSITSKAAVRSAKQRVLVFRSFSRFMCVSATPAKLLTRRLKRRDIQELRRR